MMAGALAPYETSLASSGTLSMQTDDGHSIVLDIERYMAECDAADATVMDRCRGPVLDIGCGPGRMVHALAERGLAAMGVDIAPMAVELTRSRGVPVLLRDLFSRVPGEGRWPTALVLDGNIGIGGDVDRVLERLDTLLGRRRPRRDRNRSGRRRGRGPAGAVRLRRHHDRPELRLVGDRDDGVGRTGRARRFQPLDAWSCDGRFFAELGRRSIGRRAA